MTIDTHVVNFPGDRRVMCGKLTRDVVPIVARKHVPMHQARHPETFLLCPGCADAMKADVHPETEQ